MNNQKQINNKSNIFGILSILFLIFGTILSILEINYFINVVFSLILLFLSVIFSIIQVKKNKNWFWITLLIVAIIVFLFILSTRIIIPLIWKYYLIPKTKKDLGLTNFRG